MKTVLLIGKGPSAVNAPKHIETGISIAVTNDAMKLFEGPVNYCFFTDLEMISAARDHWHRVGMFISPDKLHVNYQPEDVGPPDGFPHARHVKYPYDVISRVPREMEKYVDARKVPHHSTASAAMGWLAYQGYKEIRLCGFDGGKGNAPGLTWGVAEDYKYDSFRKAQETLAPILKRKLGVTTVWL